MRIAVLGAGYAGLTLARRLERTLATDHEIVLVNDGPTHLVQHEIHRAIRRPAIAEDIVVPLTDVLERATVEVARVERVDPESKTVHLSGPPSVDRAARAYDDESERSEHTGIESETARSETTETTDGSGDADGTTEEGEVEADETEAESLLGYDVCAVCLGAETDFRGVPGVADHATPLKRLRDAKRIRTDFLSVLPAGGRVVVCGGGLSGIQVAGELAALAREEGKRDVVEIVLTEALDRVAPAFSTEFSRAVCEELTDRDITIETNAPVERATSEGVTIDGEELPAEQLLWTGGIHGPTALGGERPIVRNTLEFGADTFVVGDAARVIDADGEAVPASAQSAVHEARAVAGSITTIVERADQPGFRPRLEPFTFDSPGWLVSVGDGAVAQVGPMVFRGAAAKALKTTVGAGYLTSVGAVHNAVDLTREELSSDD